MQYSKIVLSDVWVKAAVHSAIIVVSVFSYPFIAASDSIVAGGVSGRFEVDSQGGAHYTVPITVAPGTLSLQPELKLIYNSHADYGIVGVGWTLSGFSSITRCAIRRENRDGDLDLGLKNYPVQYTDQDRFCLDGQYLVAEPGQTYGEDGAYYRPEASPWTRVQSLGSCGSGPCRFIAVRKDGYEHHFGSDGNSRALAIAGEGSGIPQGSVRVWGIQKAQDLDGNYMTFAYNKGGDQTQFLPHKILYTANDSDGANLQHQRAVELEYIDNASVKPRYQGGAVIHNPSLLKHIKICIAKAKLSGCNDEFIDGFQSVCRYRLNYEKSPTSHRMRVTSITQFGADNKHFTPTTFSYLDPEQNAFQPITSWSGDFGTDDGFDHPEYQQRTMADVNGDGRYDLIGFGTYTTRIGISDGEKFILAPSQEMFSHNEGYSDIHLYPRLMADANGDGRQDIVGFARYAIQVALSKEVDSINDKQFGEAETWSTHLTAENGWGHGDTNQRLIADINGDGRSDVIGFGTDKLVILFSEGSTFSAPVEHDNWFTKKDGYDSVYANPRLMSDVNGDGRADIVGFKDDGEVQVGLSTGDGFSAPQTWTQHFCWEDNSADNCHGASFYYGRNPRYVQDLNGDGLGDLIGFTDSAVIVAYATGKSFEKPTVWTDHFTYDRNWDDNHGNMRVLGDVNGDRRADIIAFGRDDVFFGISIGDKFDTDLFHEIEDHFGYDSIVTNPRFPADGAGAGTVSIVGLGYTDTIVATPAMTHADLVRTINTGIGGQTSINYVSTASKPGYEVYQPSTEDVDYPIKHYNVPITVVKSYEQADGQGHSYDYVYRYRGGLADLKKRGFLGFKTVTSIDKQINQSAGADRSGLAKETTFHQIFPKKGHPERRRIFRVEDDFTIQNKQFKYDIQEVITGAFDVMLKQAETQRFSINSDKHFTTRKSFQHDAYGNTVLTKDDGNTNIADDDYQVCSRYINDDTNWRLGYEIESVVAKQCEWSADACTCSQVMEKNRQVYTKDGRWNLQYSKSWNDEDDHWLGNAFTYDAVGNVHRQSDAYWTSSDPATDPMLFDPVTTTYDTDYQTFSVRIEDSRFVEKQTNDPRFGTLLSTTDPNEVTLRFRTDGFGRLVETKGPNPQGNEVVLSKTDFVKDDNGQYETDQRRIDWGGRFSETKTYLDGLGRSYHSETVATDQCTITEETEFLSASIISKVSQPYYRSRLGKSCSLAEDVTWTYRMYDSVGQLQQIILPTGVRTHFKPDIAKYREAYREILVQTDAFGTDKAREITSYMDAHERLIHRVFPVSDAVADNPTVSQEFDPIGRLRKTTTADTVITEYHYNTLGQNRIITDTSQGTHHYYYNEKGYLKQSVDPLQQTVDSHYDDIGRLQKQIARDAADRITTHQFFYDESAHGYSKTRLTKVKDLEQNTAHEYEYDAYGNVIGSTLHIDAKSFTTRHRYDPLNRSWQFTYPDGSVQRRLYDSAGTLASVDVCAKTPDRQQCTDDADFINYATYRDYTAAGKPQTVKYREGNVSTTTYRYDDLQRVKFTKLIGASASKTLIHKVYDWTELNQIWQIRDLADDDKTQRFDFDGAGNLKRLSRASHETAFHYDDIGNLKMKGDIAFTYDGVQVVSATHLEREVYAAQYNAAGQLNQRTVINPDNNESSVWQYSHDPFNNLTKASRTIAHAHGPDTVKEEHYTYDYQGHILKRQAAGVTSYYISPLFDIAVLADGSAVYTKYVNGLKGAVASISTGSPTLRSLTPPDPTGRSFIDVLRNWWSTIALGFFVIPGSIAVWRLGNTHPQASRRTTLLVGYVIVSFTFTVGYLGPALAVDGLDPGPNGPGTPVAGKTLFFHYDVTNSNSVVTDDQGNLVSRITYDPYGEVSETLSGGADEYRTKFGGHEFYKELELYNFGVRYYDPFTGRFISADNNLVGGNEAYISSYNRYAYANNNPIIYNDPTGESVWTILAFVAGAVATGGLSSGLILAADAGIYMGATAVNHSYDPEHWDMKSSKTYLGMAAGVAISEVGFAISIAAPEAIPEEAGLLASFTAGVAADATAGFIESSSYAALGGTSFEESMKQGAIGAGYAGTFSVGGRILGAGVGRVANKLRSAATGSAQEMSSIGSKTGKMGDSLIADAGNSLCSFASDTLVATPEGPIPIEQIQPNSVVFVYNPGTFLAERGRATATFKHMASADELLELTVDGKTYTVTKDHLFAVPNQDGIEWVAAEDLIPNEHKIVGLDDVLWEQSTSPHPTKQLIEVVNFEVEYPHNYVLYEQSIITHNTCPRVKAVGHTPSKNSVTGDAVFKKMQKQGYARVNKGGSKSVKVRTTKNGKRVWKKLNSKIHMGHKVDAVKHWNAVLRNINKPNTRWTQTRAWMNDPKNYVFEWGRLNKANGAKAGKSHQYQFPPGKMKFYPWQ